MLQQLYDAIIKGSAKEAENLVAAALEAGISAQDILEQGMLKAMEEIGEKFKNNDIFIPEVLVAARAMNKATDKLKPALLSAGIKPKGKAVCCTVKGDIHDIGKNIVKLMLEGQGVEVVDLGVDVPAAKIVDAVKSSGAQVVCLSCLLTTTMMAQKEVIDAFKAAGIRDKVKILIGGAPITAEFAASIGADGFAPDAARAATMVRGFLE